MKNILLSILLFTLFAGCPPPSYLYWQSEIADFEKAQFSEIDRTVFPNNVHSMVNKERKIMWTGLVRDFKWDDIERVARFSVEHRFVLRVPYPLTSSGMKLLGHPDYYYVSKESEGDFTCAVRLKISPDSSRISEITSGRYAFTFAGKLASGAPIHLAANFLERFPLSGEIDVIMPRDSTGKIIMDHNGNIAFEIKEQEQQKTK